MPVLGAYALTHPLREEGRQSTDTTKTANEKDFMNLPYGDIRPVKKRISRREDRYR